MARKTWIHYGTDTFSAEKVKENSKRLFSNKPNGLWASPTDRKALKWKDFCLGENFHTDRLEKSFKFRVSNKANLLWVHELKDAEKYIIKEKYHNYHFSKLDVEKIMNKYDGMVLIHGKHYWELHETAFYTWDVDSICVWNPDVIEII